ncbi:SdrD B-like domain-containing protein [Persicobacter diffluens]|uniref:HYR domain-containing protein n=1 Tax=Persicobacter diffluens TaxID=981 RepID=A0AAN5AKD3_9BACT|nr:hypothetical protein PEDI_32920 [Persicobacter diffluens]
MDFGLDQLGEAGDTDRYDSDGNALINPNYIVIPFSTGFYGENNHTLDFGFILNSASIGNFVWYDLDRDGIQDPGEEGVAGVTVNLLAGDGTFISTVNTDANGYYLFDNLAPGDYKVEFDLGTLPTDYVTSPKDSGSDDESDSDADASTLGMTPVVTLGPGDENLSLDLGINLPSASIGDFVWYDLDRDGIQDEGEEGVPGITVQLKDEELNIIAEVITDANGNYLFDNLDAGTYSIVFDLTTVPDSLQTTLLDAGGDDGLDSDSDPLMAGMTPFTELSPGEEDLSFDLGLITKPASIGNFVWYDLDRDGIQDPGEEGVAGVTVNLLAGDGTFISTVNTDANGYYLFDNLAPGDYKVEFDLGTLPTDYVTSPKDSGSDDEADSDADASTLGMTPVVTLGPGDENLSLDLGINLPSASIGDFVWYDSDRDGIQDEGEEGVPGITVQLKDEELNIIAEVITDANGNYLFDNLDAGTYSIVFDLTTVPDSLQTTLLDAGGDDGLDSDSDPLMAGMTPFTELSPGEEDLSFDLGLITKPASIGNFVWYDLDRDGIQDPGEEGVAGVTVNLLAGDGTFISTVNTDANGYYLFDNLAPGDYKVEFDLGTLPTDYVTSPKDSGSDDEADSDADASTLGMTPVVTLGPGDENLSLDLGINLPSASIGDFVWYDSDRDGIQDEGEEGVPGITVQLKDEELNIIAEVITDANGNYLFDNLDAGTYSIVFDLTTVPDSLQTTLLDAGGDDGLDSDSDPLMAGMTPFTELSPGEEDLSFDLGLITKPASIGNFVWYDLDRDGIQDPGEEGVAGVTVNLLAGDGTFISTVNTDANGYYLFDNLAPGDYKIEFDLGTLPTDYVTSPKDSGSDDEADSDADASTLGMTPVVTLGPGDENLSLDLGINLPVASLGDFVWFDENENGIQDDGELGVPNVTVYLKNEALDVVATTVTGADGSYIFDQLEPNIPYSVVFVESSIPAGYTATVANAGSNDELDSDADVTTGGMTPFVTLSPGEYNSTLDFGIYCVPPIIEAHIMSENPVCPENAASISLQADVIGDEDVLANMPILWETNGQGTFISTNTLITTYYPTTEEIANGGEIKFTVTIQGLCTEVMETVTLTIYPTPEKPSQEDIIVCEGETIAEIDFGYGVKWEKVSFTGEIGLDGENNENYPNILPAFLAKNGTAAYLSNTIKLVKVSEFGCESEPHYFEIIVHPTPATPIATGDAVCFDDQAGTLSVTSGDPRFQDIDLIFNWYDSEGGQLLAQGTEFMPETGLAAGTYTYFVTASKAYGDYKYCEGPGVEVEYTIFPRPAKPLVEDLHYCSGEEVHPYKLGFGKPGTFEWEFKDGMNSIGMSENSGENYLPKFTAINTSGDPVTNTIKVRVIDENGCVSRYAEFDITIHPAPKVSLLTAENPGCNGDADGAVSFYVYGGSPKEGNPAYDWDWNGHPDDVMTMSDASGMTFDADHLAGSIKYTLTVTDKYGCMAEESVTLKNPSNLDVEIEETQSILCYGDMNGELTAIIDGGTYNDSHEDCIFIWTHVESSTTFGGPVWSGLGAGTYWLTVIDENGCTADAVYKLKQPDLLEITDVATTDVTCYGAADGTATITAIGGTLFDYGDYRYSLEGTDWQNYEVSHDPQKSNVFVNLAAGSYKVIVEDKNGCMAMEDFKIEQPTEVEFVSCEIVDVTCPENLDGSITITAQGGTPGYMYKLDDGGYQASNVFEYLAKGSYDVFVKDANGCTAKKEVTIGVQPDVINPEFDYKPADTMVACGDDTSPEYTGMATATDNCEGVEVTYEDETVKGECPAFQVIIRTWTATDYYGNKVSCEQRIEIKDEEKPYFTKYPQDREVHWGDAYDPLDDEVKAADDCSGLKHLCFEDEEINYLDCEYAEFKRKWIAIDSCDNKEYTYQTITIKGQRPLHLTCPDDIVVYASRGDNGAFVDFQEKVSTTNTGLRVNYSHRSGDYFPIGETEVTITAKDDCGNRRECRFTIRVKDTPRENGAIYINANGKEVVTTKDGLVFDYDKYYNGGTGYTHRAKEIYQTENDQIHLTERYGRNFSYAIPAQRGQHYKVTLFFSENYHNYANRRKFSVAMESEEIMKDFDIFAEAGGKCIGITREFKVYADDEYLNLAFYCGPNGLDNAKVDGICVMPIDDEEILGYYVNANGARDYTTEEGYNFKRDAYYSGGATYKVAETTEIEGTNDDYLYTTERYGRDFSYRMPSKAGQYYQVKLFFAEVYHREAGKRIFNVDIDGENKLYGYDIVGKAGARYRAVCETFEVYAQADHMNIRFYKGDNGVDMAKVSAICIVPIDKPEEPVYTYYVNAHGTEVYESYDGYIFGEDQYFYGGKTYYASGSQIDNSYDDELFRSERYGENFLYRIPARHGKEYEVKLFFAETYWNEAGDRTFHVDIEGQRKLELFDIYAEAGGKNKAVCKTFYVTADGNALDIKFYIDGYCADNAKISAICVMPKDEAPENAREVDLPSIVAPETIVGNLKAYPNPAAEYFNLNVLVEEQDQFEVQLIDMTGVIHNIKGDSIERLEDEVKVFIEDMKLVGGTYMVRYNHNGINSEFLKLMVE